MGQALEEWDTPHLVNVIRSISHHVARFVEYDGALYALKELPTRPARREWGLLRALESQEMPAVEAVGIVTDRVTRASGAGCSTRTDFYGSCVEGYGRRLRMASAELTIRRRPKG